MMRFIRVLTARPKRTCPHRTISSPISKPLDHQKLTTLVEDVHTFYQFSQPMQDLLKTACENNAPYVVSSAHPRIVDGAPSKNPRYLQIRPDLVNPVRTYIAETSARFHRKLDLGYACVSPG